MFGQYFKLFGKYFEILKQVQNKKNGKRPTSHRSTTYLCYVPILEDFAGAGRVGLAGANIQSFCFFARILEQYKYICDRKFNYKK